MIGSGNGIQRIPNDVCRTCLYWHCKRAVFQNPKSEIEECCWARLLVCKDVFRMALRKIRDEETVKGAKKCRERIYWGLRALEGHFQEDAQMLERAIHVAPFLTHDGSTIWRASWMMGKSITFEVFFPRRMG